MLFIFPDRLCVLHGDMLLDSSFLQMVYSKQLHFVGVYHHTPPIDGAMEILSVCRGIVL
ncbi:MAG TPA: hypothetical protein PLX23_08165 [Candidatus Hydrogenedens sp.]|nr:hypothetical protein [Candidatus Hydrogenedens sp.]